jgi:outer membrane receptor protein involved in Fe transport
MSFKKTLPLSALYLLSASTMLEAAEHETISLADITVTGERTQESVLDQPLSIGLKQQDQVALDNASTQKELLNSIAGVRITQTGSVIGHMTSIRLPRNTGPYYLFLQDSIPVQSSGFFNHNGLAYTNFSSAGSVEVLKGAGTALYGSDAVAATINVLSTPARDQLGVTGGVEAGSDGYRKYSVSGGIDIDDNSTVTVQGSHAESDGWRDHTEYDRQEVAVKYINDLNDDNTIKLGFSANKTVAEMAGSLIGYDEFKNNPTSVGNIQTALDSGLPIERKFDFARANAEWDHRVSDTLSINSIAYLRSTRNRYTATWQDSLPHNDSEDDTLGLLFKANMQLGAMTAISGIDFEYTKASREYLQRTTLDSVPAGKIYDYDVNYTAISPYTRLEFQLTEKLTLGTGLRFDYNSFEYTNNVADGQYAGTSFFRASSDTDPSFTHFSPKLDLTYKLNNNQTVYARYANGFRIPQASRLYSLTTKNIDFSLDEEVTNTFEVGYKFAYERHQFASSIYLLTIDDTIVERRFSSNQRFYENGGKTEHRGIELSLTSKLSDEVTSHIAHSYSRHDYQNDEVFNSNEQAEAPNNVSNVRLVYSPKAIAGLSSMLEWEHVGSYWLDDAHAAGRYKGHDVANIKLNYQVSDKLNLTAKINNVTDRVFAESAQFRFGSERYTPGAPRQVFVGFDYKL